MRKREPRILHLIPSLKTGGAETAALNYLRSAHLRRRYFVVVFRGVDAGLLQVLPTKVRRRVLSIAPGRLTWLTGRLIGFLRRHRSSVIITSMWPSALALMVASVCWRFPKHVAFTHRSSSAHVVDSIVRNWQVRHSMVNLADSEKSAQWVRRRSQVDVTVLPAVFASGLEAGARTLGKSIRLCFVGRIAPVKNLGGILDLFELLLQGRSDLALDIFGPDGGDLAAVLARIAARGLGDAVRYKGVLSPDRVQETVHEYDFLILLSHTEGMALSVVEAMRMGVVPIVGKVGGPGDYCRSGLNAVVVDSYSEQDMQRAAAELLRIFSVPDDYRRLSAGASETFDSRMLFETEFNRVLSTRFDFDAG